MTKPHENDATTSPAESAGGTAGAQVGGTAGVQVGGTAGSQVGGKVSVLIREGTVVTELPKDPKPAVTFAPTVAPKPAPTTVPAAAPSTPAKPSGA